MIDAVITCFICKLFAHHLGEKDSQEETALGLQLSERVEEIRSYQLKPRKLQIKWLPFSNVQSLEGPVDSIDHLLTFRDEKGEKNLEVASSCNLSW